MHDRSSRPCSRSRDELLATIDVIGRPCQGRVAHDVNGQRGDISRPDDAPDGQRRAELAPPLFEVIAEQRFRQRRIDETRSNQIDADWRKLKRKISDKGGKRDGSCRCDREANPRTTRARASDEY